MKHFNIKAKFLTLVSVLSLSLSSCGDFLLIEPKTFVTEDNFWNEKTDVEQMVAGVYCMLQNSSIISRCIVWGELRSDNIMDGKDVAKNDDLYRTLRENLRANNSYTDWTQFYKTINAAQIVIERAPTVAEKDPTYTPSQVLATQAEMKAIKALCMFTLVRAFKDCPYPKHAVQSEDDIEPMPAVSGDSIVRVLIAELEGCVDQALRKYPKDENRDHNSNYNRITQSSIYAILCDLCLWNGDYQKVVDYAEKIYDQKWLDFDEGFANDVNMGSGGKPVVFLHDNDSYSHLRGKHTGYPLYPCYSGSNEYGSHYNAIFGEGNSFESVFELAYTPSASGGKYIPNNAIGSLYGSRGDGEMSEGPLFAHEQVYADAVNKIYKVYDHQYDVRYYINSAPDGDQYSKGYPAKYVCNSITVEPQSSSQIPFKASYRGSTRSDRNWIFYRLTDIMLMQAEALVELAGNDLYTTDENGDQVVDENLNRAFTIIWAINRRSLMTPNYNTTTSVTQGLVLKQDKYKTKDDMRELVQKERRRELMFEGKRWFDLVRRCHRDGCTTDYVKRNVPSKGGNTSGAILFVNYESLFWPYNKTELKSNTALTQKSIYGGDDDEKTYESSAKK